MEQTMKIAKSKVQIENQMKRNHKSINGYKTI